MATTTGIGIGIGIGLLSSSYMGIERNTLNFAIPQPGVRITNISVRSPAPKHWRLFANASVSTTQLDDKQNPKTAEGDIGFVGIHHVGLICENLERSLEFYCGLLGLETCKLRPDKKLWYRGAWLWVGDQMVHLMELPNPDPVSGRPAHGGEDRHICVSIEHPERLKTKLESAGIPYTMSKSGRPVIFARDPDGNALEFQPSYMHVTPKDK